ncbi:MAG: glycine cleavage system protein GcvH [Polyangiaceae bacterium]
MANDFPAGLKYTKDHEWAKTDGGDIVVGITQFAVEQLGDITLVSFDAKEGATIEKGKAFGTIESVKTLSDLYAPVSGTIVRLNRELENKPELVNEDCYGKAWMIAIKPSGAEGDLMDAAAYAAHVAAAG